ncbi:hypothetical protein JZ751_027575 [Albula glossodonta]|uniref:Ig-like domain-containing protein n=1 Tax=Albula glossodonta TaxID=121402 RepID=A0A8T2MPP8_9TELE|nr:hypothetical protein JZ751_027575 [Albula glossodonta]
MEGAERFILIGCLLQGALSREDEFVIWMPQRIEALSGSCVLIPCRFEIPTEYDKQLVPEAKGLWMKGGTHEEQTVFKSRLTENQSNIIQGKIIGNLDKKNCTTILENFTSKYNDKYFFRIESNDKLRANFRKHGVKIFVKDSPPKPKLTPVKVEVTEGSSVSLSCSAAAPCPTLPPTLTWTPRLSDSEDQLQENQDQTKSVSSVLTFTASHLHHGQRITCTALYKLQQGDTQKTFMPQISGSGSCSRTAAEISCSCESRGNPSPSMEWRVSGLRVTNSTDRVIREEQLGNTGLRSSLTMRHSQGDTPTLLCLSTNAAGNSSLQLHVPPAKSFLGLYVALGILRPPSPQTGEEIYANQVMVTRRQRQGEEHGEAETQTQIQMETQSQAADDSLHYASVTFSARTNKQESSGAVKDPPQEAGEGENVLYSTVVNS